MRNNRTLKLMAVLAAVAVFTMSTGTALAWLINRGYAGPYPTQYTVNSGTMYGDYNASHPAGVGSYGQYTSFHWTSTAVTWMKARLSDNGTQRNKPAIVYHSQTKQSGGCGGLNAINWSSSNLPGARNQPKNHCGYDEEIRVLADAPSQLVGYANYYVQVQYNYRNGTTGGQLTIDTYWLDWWDNPSSTGGASNGGRGYMDKICFNHPGSYYHPSGGSC